MRTLCAMPETPSQKKLKKLQTSKKRFDSVTES